MKEKNIFDDDVEIIEEPKEETKQEEVSKEEPTEYISKPDLLREIMELLGLDVHEVKYGDNYDKSLDHYISKYMAMPMEFWLFLRDKLKEMK